MTEKTNSRKILKYGTVSIITVFSIFYVFHMIWINSGSNEWKLKMDENGIKIWTLKSPSIGLLKYKMNMQVDATLADAIFYMTDIDTGADLGAIDLKRIDNIVDSATVINYDTYKIDFGFPFNMREFVIMNQYTQDPKTKVVDLNILAAPNKIPADKNLKRIVHLSNHWRYTPLENGKVDIQVLVDMDLRIPYFMSNFASPDILYETSVQMRDLLKLEKYKNKKPELIMELNESSLANK